MSDYPTWRADRLAELDAMQPKIDELPPTIRNCVINEPHLLRQRVEELNGGGHAYDVGKWIERKITRLAAELDRIVVVPASEDGEEN